MFFFRPSKRRWKRSIRPRKEAHDERVQKHSCQIELRAREHIWNLFITCMWGVKTNVLIHIHICWGDIYRYHDKAYYGYLHTQHTTVTSISFRTRGSLKKSNVKPLTNTDSLHEVFLINLSLTDRWICFLAPRVVRSVSISITSLSWSHSDILRLSTTLSVCCSVLLLKTSVTRLCLPLSFMKDFYTKSCVLRRSPPQYTWEVGRKT